MIEKIKQEKYIGSDGSEKIRKKGFFEFEKDEDKYYYIIVNQKRGALFLKDLLDHILNNTNEYLFFKDRETGTNFLKMYNDDFFWSNKYYNNKFIPYLIKGRYITKHKNRPKNDYSKGTSTVYYLLMDCLLDLLLPFKDDINQRADAINRGNKIAIKRENES